MIRKNLSELKNSKPFFIFDLLIYFLSAGLIVILFCAVFISRQNGDYQGVYIIYNNSVVAEYYFNDGNLKIQDGFSSYLNKTDDGVYFYPNGVSDGDYNLIIFDGDTKTVYIKASTCIGHDCEKQQITGGVGFIYCAPHKLKITPMGLTEPVTG